MRFGFLPALTGHFACAAFPAAIEQSIGFFIIGESLTLICGRSQPNSGVRNFEFFVPGPER